MDVSGVGAAPTNAQYSIAIRELAAPLARSIVALEGVPQSGDTIAATLRLLSDISVLNLLEKLEGPPSQENTARIDDLLHAAISAVVKGNVEQALVKLEEFAVLNPRRAENLESEPALAPVRSEVGQLLFRLTTVAHLDAQSRLEQATQLLLNAASPNETLRQELKPEIAILIAGRLVEAGGYANFVRSAALSQMAIVQYGFVPSPPPQYRPDPTSSPISFTRSSLGLLRRWAPRIGMLWRRAPILMLLLAWLAIGLVGGSIFAVLRSYWPQSWPESSASSGFEIWAIGFLALVALGFYAKVRNIVLRSNRP